MTINIIHLPERTDRHAILIEELRRANITDYMLWNGIKDEAQPHVGISRAHKQIVRHAQELGLTEVLIAEDDLRFTSRNSFDYFINHIPNEYDLYLASVYHGRLHFDNSVAVFSGLTFYVVNQRFYQHFLGLPENNHLDIVLANQGKYIVSNPFTVIQHNGYSDNSRRICNYDYYLLGRKLLSD